MDEGGGQKFQRNGSEKEGEKKFKEGQKEHEEN